MWLYCISRPAQFAALNDNQSDIHSPETPPTQATSEPRLITIPIRLSMLEVHATRYSNQ